MTGHKDYKIKEPFSPHPLAIFQLLYFKSSSKKLPTGSPNTIDILYSVSIEQPIFPFLNSSLRTKSYDRPISTASCSCVIPAFFYIF